MKDPITETELAQCIRAFGGDGDTSIIGRALSELKNFRHREIELWALVGRMRHYSANLPTTTFINDGKIEATDDWLRELDSLLSAHGTQETGSCTPAALSS